MLLFKEAILSEHALICVISTFVGGIGLSLGRSWDRVIISAMPFSNDSSLSE